MRGVSTAHSTAGFSLFAAAESDARRRSADASAKTTRKTTTAKTV